jgi:uncharacterized protein (UPF0335 family)
MSEEMLSADANGRLRSFVERLERLGEDADAIKADVKEVFAELKGEGFDPKAMRKLLRIRKQDRAKRQEEAAIVELYAAAIGEVLP